MRKVCILTVLAGVLLLAVACSTAFAVGYLKIHPSNPHYFQEDGTGRPILIATYTAIVPESTDFDYTALIAEMGQRRIAYARVWHFCPWGHEYQVWPWARSSVPGAPMGGNKMDMDTWNTTYWTRMNDAMSKANTVGTYAEMMLFDRCGLSPASYDRYECNPWASDNNINSLEMPTAVGNDGTPDFYYWSSKPNLKYQQERYIKKMIDETIDDTNVFYEIENEHWDSNSSGWADHYGTFVKDYISANYPTQPRLVSYSSIISDADLDQCFGWSGIDIVNRHYGGELETDPSVVTPYIEARWGYNKPINIDEFANGVTDPAMLRQMCWTIVTSGGHYHIEDAQLSAKGFDVCENIRSFIALSGWDFISASPDSSLMVAGTGALMKNPGTEYVAYFVSGNRKTINLAAGNYRQEWWNPRTGGFYNITNISHSGGNRNFTSPDSSDWVLHLTTAPAPTTVLTSKSAGAITIDGATGDWSLGEFTTKICGGNVGTGDTGIVEFDTDGVCYTGGHLDAWQVLPSSATDHAVKIYSRNNASYLYFLIRLTDNDMQYGNPTSANWANDCVEFYIDPGHDGGASGISSSTSDLQLVIDANNQKNVYMTTSGYATQVLAGVTSAVVRDSTGWWLEAQIQKSVLDPDIPTAGTIGIDFYFRDNDNNNDTTLTTITSWRECEVSTAFPTKIPNRWGDLNLQSAPDTTPPANVTGLTATPSDMQISLSWTNPSDWDFTGTMIRYKTTGYPTSTTDGTLVVDDSGTPGAADGYTHTGLTNGTTYYYTAFAHDSVPNYASGAQVSGAPTAEDITPPGPVTSFTATAGNTLVSLSWTNPTDPDFAGTMIRFKTTGYPTGPTDGTQCYNGTGTSYPHTGLTNGVTYYYCAYAYDEVPNYSTAAQASATPDVFTVCFLENFNAGTNRNLYGWNGWTGSNDSGISIGNNGTALRIYAPAKALAIACNHTANSCTGNTITVSLTGGGTVSEPAQGANTAWRIYAFDGSGNEMGSFYGTGTSVAGRIGGAVTSSYGWLSNTAISTPLEMRIEPGSDHTHFYRNGVEMTGSPITFTSTATAVASVQVYRYAMATNAKTNCVYFDDLQVGADN